MNSEPTFLTMLIPAYNEERRIGKTLEGMIAYFRNKDFRTEILVVDDGSTDGTRQVVRRFTHTHPHIKVHTNQGRTAPAAMNLGLRMSRGDIVIRVDGHMFLAEDYVSKCVGYLAKMELDCVGGTIQNVGTSLMANAIAVAMSSPFGVGNAYFRYSKKRRYVDTLAFGAYRRDVFDRVGFFDETLVRCQDSDFNHRLRRIGGRLLLVPDVKAYYHTRSTLRGLWEQFFKSGYWKVRMLKKDPGALRLRQIPPPLALLAVVVLAILNLVSWGTGLVLLGLVCLYILSGMLFVLGKIAARRLPFLRTLVLMPVVFSTMHVGWGLGFWIGVYKFLVAGKQGRKSRNRSG